jgi:hypothetical protein
VTSEITNRAERGEKGRRDIEKENQPSAFSSSSAYRTPVNTSMSTAGNSSMSTAGNYLTRRKMLMKKTRLLVLSTQFAINERDAYTCAVAGSNITESDMLKIIVLSTFYR